jgi:hypothetical protein
MAANKRYVKPTIDEGFDNIILVNQQTTFSESHMEQLYFEYLLDK